MSKSTKCQAPVISAVAQAITIASVAASPSVGARLHADSATNVMSDGILAHALPHQVACFSTAHTAFDWPPAEPDPVTGVTLLKPSNLYDCTPNSEMLHAHQPDDAVHTVSKQFSTIFSFSCPHAYIPNPVIQQLHSGKLVIVLKMLVSIMILGK